MKTENTLLFAGIAFAGLYFLTKKPETKVGELYYPYPSVGRIDTADLRKRLLFEMGYTPGENRKFEEKIRNFNANQIVEFANKYGVTLYLVDKATLIKRFLFKMGYVKGDNPTFEKKINAMSQEQIVREAAKNEIALIP